VYVHGRREAFVILGVWATCLVWTVGTSYALGFGAPSSAVKTVWGIPHWVFWGVLMPWIAATVFSVVFSFAVMADDDLGEDLPDTDADEASPPAEPPAEGGSR
jgi:hypothetical protein